MAISNVDIKARCEELVTEMFAKGKTFHGKPLSSSFKPMIAVEGNKNAAKILVPYWWPVTQYGRGKRRTTKTEWTNFKGAEFSTFQLAIYMWMEKYNRFKAKTEKGKINEAKSVAWYINKYGDAHKRSGTFIDIYDTLVKQLSEKLTKEVGMVALKITSDFIKL